MIDAATIALAAGAVSLLKEGASASIDIADAAKRLRDQFRGRPNDPAADIVAEIQERLLASQGRQLALQAQLGELLETLRSEEAFAAHSQRYQLERLPSGSFVYRLKQENAEQEPDHFACPLCWERRKRMILQPMNKSYSKCPDCKTQFQVNVSESPNVNTRKSTNTW